MDKEIKNAKSFLPIWTIVFILINFFLYFSYPFDKIKFDDYKINQCLLNKKTTKCEQLAQKETYELSLKGQYFESYQKSRAISSFCFIDNYPECYHKDFIQIVKLSLRPNKVLKDGEWYRLFTAAFMHASLYHLMNNMIFLLIFGSAVEYYLRKRFVFFYILSTFLTNLSIVFISSNSLKFEMGASGVIFSLMAASFILYKNAGVICLKIGSIKLPIISRNRITPLAFINLCLFLLLGGLSKVSYLSHLLGFVSGFILIFPFKKGLLTLTLLNNFKNTDKKLQAL